MESLAGLREQRVFRCRLSPDRTLESVEEADAFLRDRGLLTRTADCALPSLYEACHEDPYQPGSPGFATWPATKWPWFGELADRGHLIAAVHRGKSLLVSSEVARLLDPICRAEITRMRAADRGWGRLLDHLAAAGPSSIEDLRLELGLKRQELKALRAPLERCGAVVSRSLHVTAGQEHQHSSELVRWDQAYQGSGGTGQDPVAALGDLIAAAVRAAVLAPETELRRWFSWPWYWSDSLVDDLIGQGRLRRIDSYVISEAGLVAALTASAHYLLSGSRAKGDDAMLPPGEDNALLERAGELATLERSLVTARDGRGSFVLVSGEAGVGKTALVRAFCAAYRGAARVLWGMCDPLFTPRPLGPLLDIADAAGGELAEVAQAGARSHDVATALRRELGGRQPTIVVVDDAQWADQATLDVLRLLASRLQGVRAAVIVAYRDDELDRRHPLRIVVGEIGAGHAIARIRLNPLSLDAVTDLAARYGASPAELYDKTLGNPFFVTEVLAGGEVGVPATVRDAVLARAARLSPMAGELLELVAIVPSQAELWLLDRLIDDASGRLEECVAGGMLTERSASVSFRHELARQALEAAIGEHRKARLHRAVLAALAEPPSGPPDLARLAHHADAAGDEDALLRFAPAAAARASKLGAHREAALLCGRALSITSAVPLSVRARLFEGRAAECFLTVQFEAAAEAMRRALDCYAELGDRPREGNALRSLSHLVWETGVLAEAKDMALRAVAILEPLGPTWRLVAAYGQVARLLIADEDPEGAGAWAARATELAAQMGDDRSSLNACQTVGWVEYFSGRPGGLQRLERCLGRYEAAGLEADAVITRVVIARTAARFRQYDVAERHINAGLAYCEGIDFDVYRYYLLSWRAKLRLAAGRWDEAAQIAGIVLGDPCPFARIHALVALGLVRARRGDPDPWTPLDEALESAQPHQELQWIVPVAMARAEAAWLEGRNDAVIAATDTAFEFSRAKDSSYTTGLAYWRWRAGLKPEIPIAEDDPYALEMAGEWARAAKLWAALGCPYESALALASSGDEDALRQALAEFQQLGARPAAAIVTRSLHERGVRGLPRGPRPATQHNAASLTAREVEVLALIAQGLRSADVADRLFLSPKTVDHHVSAILRKLDVRTRGEASAEAARLGLVNPR